MEVLKKISLLSLLFCSLLNANAVGTASNSSVEILTQDVVKISENNYLIGVKYKFDPGWHTYWINPGDSGEKAIFNWNLPQGYSISSPKWPAPEVIPYPPLMTYGYENEVIILFNLNKDSQSDTNDEIILHSEWLACADICLPQEGSSSVNLEEIINSTNNSDSEILKVKESLPSKFPSKVLTTIDDDKILLKGEINDELKNSNIYFFPYNQNLITHTASQNSTFDVNSFTHSVERNKNNDFLSEIKGVISFTKGGEIKSFYFSSNTLSTSSSLSILNLTIALISAFIGGLLLNLMPCVFPVISLKIFNFIEISNNKKEVLFHGLSFSIGSILTFVSIGILILILKILGSEIGWGFQLQSPLFVAILIYLFVILFLNFTGVFNIPNLFSNLGINFQESNSYKNSFGTGVLAVAVATPCTAPFMGSALGLALTQPNIFSILIFLFLGLGFSLPYLIISLFPKILDLMPKPGDWMETFRKIMAVPIFLTILWLVWILSNQVMLKDLLYVFIGISFITILCFLKEITGFFRLSLKYFKPVFASLFLLSIYLLPLNLEKMNSIQSEISLDEIEKLSQLGPLFINFTADWCITCKVNEQIALNSDYFESIIESKGINYLKIDWTNKDININKLIESYGRSGIPLYVYYPYEEYGPVFLPEILNQSILENYLEFNY